MKIPYFPGCALKASYRNLESSALAVAEKLGLEMVELPRWNCCGAVHSLVSDDLMRRVAPIRALLRVKQMIMAGETTSASLVTLCSMCFNTLKRSALFAEENLDKLETINIQMDEEDDYDGGIQVRHLLEVLRDLGFEEISRRTVKPLKGLKVAPYYGCLLLKPRGVGIDDPENPRVMEDLMETLRVEVVESPYRSRCCGGYQTVDKKEVVIRLARDILTYAIKGGAEVVAITCPLCFFNLDERQRDIVEIDRDWREIPILFFTQIMAMAFDLGANVCDFSLHYVDPRPLLKEKGILR